MTNLNNVQMSKELSTENLGRLKDYVIENKRTSNNGKYINYDYLLTEFSVSEDYVDEFLLPGLKKIGLIDDYERFAKREFYVY